MKGEFVVYNKLTNEVLGVGTFKELSYICGFSYSALVEHYRDRNNKHRFVASLWSVETKEVFFKEHPKWKLME